MNRRLKEYREATLAIPKASDMFRYLREQKYGDADNPKAVLLRCPSSYGFIELTRQQYEEAVTEFERICTIGLLMGEKASPLQRIGIMMLLGWDYDHFAEDKLCREK